MKKIPPVLVNYQNKIQNIIIPECNGLNISISFKDFKFEEINLPGEFNNHFKDDEHFRAVLSEFMTKVLPTISSHKANDMFNHSSIAQELHFHMVDDDHKEKVRNVLEKLSFNKAKIDQIFEGNLFQFSAHLGHKYPARIFGYCVENIFYFLFLDTNHHIYFNEKYVSETVFFEDCPKYKANQCNYMPMDCFAVSYLDEKKLEESFGYQA